MRFCTILLTLLTVLYSPAKGWAQQQQPPNQDALVAEFIDLLFERHRGFVASEAVLENGFASHLFSEDDPQTVTELSARGAAYDPLSATGLTAGMLSFHLARPVEILRELGGGPNEVFARIVEIRLRWLGGRPDLALAQANELIGQMDEEGMGWDDPDMVSVLADAAVLSLRAGQVEAAQTYFARARVCGEHRCPADTLFSWLGERRKSSSDRFPGYDAKDMARAALAQAEVLLPDDKRVLEDIRLEQKLAIDGGAILQKALALALATDDPGNLSEAQRREMRVLAGRIAGLLDFESYQMGSDSAAGNARLNAIAGRKPGEIDVDDIGYLSPTFSNSVMTSMPLIYALLRVSDQRGHEVVADLTRIRVILAAGEPERGLRELSALYARASAAGYTDAELFSVLMDIAAVAQLTGQADVAATAAIATRQCRETPCFEDFALQFYQEVADGLPRIAWPGNLTQLRHQSADAFMRTTFPGDLLKLADVYETGASQSRPMDAARNDLLSLSLAEKADNISPEDLAKRAASVMDTLIYAGRYADALAVGDRIAGRLEREGATEALSRRFFQIRARAAFRVDDPRARAFYERAVDLGWSEDLVLDLLDTSFLDLLDRLVGRYGGDASIRARLRYRQGRYEEAGDILAEDRRQKELGAAGSRMAEFFAVRAEVHLRNGDLDGYVRETLRAQAAETGDDIPADHPWIYSYFWDLKLSAWQEAVYREAGGDLTRAQYLKDLGGFPTWFYAEWEPLGDRPEPEAIARFERRQMKSDDSYDLIRDVIETRDNGNYEGAAQYLKSKRWVAIAAEANGQYVDAQALWQMAFTFARAGETGIAFDLMNRAAKIAARLSFEGAGGADGGTLQLLERDRWRYLLFVDIAWAAVSGQAPQDMLVVSRY